MYTAFFMGQFIIDKVVCVSRYIIPETGYMTATSALEVKLSHAFKYKTNDIL